MPFTSPAAVSVRTTEAKPAAQFADRLPGEGLSNRPGRSRKIDTGDINSRPFAPLRAHRAAQFFRVFGTLGRSRFPPLRMSK